MNVPHHPKPNRAAHGLATLFVLSFAIPLLLLGQPPPGIVNSPNPHNVSLAPGETLARITVPDGFNVTLFAREPHVAQPIAITFDDQGRLWVTECFGGSQIPLIRELIVRRLSD